MKGHRDTNINLHEPPVHYVAWYFYVQQANSMVLLFELGRYLFVYSSQVSI